MRQKLRAYYWDDRPNFGDRLCPYLLQRFTRLNVEWSPASSADVVTIGSLLSHLAPSYQGMVAGTGLLHKDWKIDLPLAEVIGVRGPLTAAKFPHKSLAIGDPGLLVNELVPHQEKLFDLGIIAHWTDEKLAVDQRFVGNWNRVVIDASAHPLEVVRTIAQCRKIVTSSLHGAIVADAFMIPRRIELAEKFIRSPHEGGTFKFEDYHASIGLPFRVGEVQLANHHYVNDRQSEAFDMYRAIRNRYV